MGPLKQFEIKICYLDYLGKKHTRKRTIDIKQFSGLRGVLAKSANRKAADSLEKIERHLGIIAGQSNRFSAFVDITEFKDQYIKVAKGNE